MDSRPRTPRPRAGPSADWPPDDGPVGDETREPAVDDEREAPEQSEPPARPRRRRGVIAAVVVALVAAGIYGLCTLGPVRTVLRQSFTQMSSPYLQFYFNGTPWVSGELLNVPLGIIPHGENASKYDVRLWVVDHAGKTDYSSTVALPVRGGMGTENYSLLVPPGGEVVWAQVSNTSLSLHFRFAGSAFFTQSSAP